MKTPLTLLLTFLLGSYSFAQEVKLDSTWTINGKMFQIVLTQKKLATPPINTSIALFRDGKIILTDSLWCSLLNVELEDMDDDGYSDLLVYQGSGARANETYNLFLFKKEKNDFQKVKGFDEWPNLEKTKIKGVLSSKILTGTIEYRFFEFDNNGELKDLNISVEERTYNGKAYKIGIKQVKKIRNYKKNSE